MTRVTFPYRGTRRQSNVVAPETSSTGVRLGLRGLDKRFGATHVLDAIDLAITPGQFVAIVGRSGCGKSTLLRLVAGLETATDGEIRVDDQPAARHAADTRLMFQDARLLPWKRVVDNVGIGLRGRWQDRAREVLHDVGLADKADAWPAQLSGGQQQRVALARALIHRPRLLLLDEPLGALDALTRLEMQSLIEALWQHHGFTVLLVTHDVPEAVQLADRVVVLEQGGVGLDLAVDLPRPREAATPAVSAVEGRVLDRVLGRSDVPTSTTASATRSRTASAR
ncbi:ATP-binding cassette domain-containing protein [Salinisphaera sp. Q1T1-3]|uniref:ATP-binding cassette domain-containing protein n=1 Tax=Salinisphaera sp. Q1T1-3 TaxID=2321229 RepID=UPI000E73DD26|nr:ATP-binding cassette domain-containing protein [Salinisphaera sp. Q1T1-3]RJS95129.1 ATP-binding cassette domain-containing protein [Salinisphaera sp. Q1T1-3]